MMDAATTTTIASPRTQLSVWPSNIQPASPATTGSRLSSTPNVCALKRLIAANSNEYGSIDDSTATPSRGISFSGCPVNVGTAGIPKGSTTMAAMNMLTERAP